ncbi:hypothetical protein XU18_3316 [Perkinsela sp. CCAP 1560/4]|nr:hypothetical protein XU18_5040 [Perkinsela sp. CCAP 1560/4]KNH05648.1 hypothetical protein XU18_3316 [Perkinsela sp. CCAP 1560/4]|eukprot:KNH03636.1 hypothetical protein XU18_5040 [Perkinsela sp. CCAP 1560/4]
MDPRGLTGAFTPQTPRRPNSFSPGGGATPNVGQPGKTMYMRPFDDYTRPMTRSDFIKAINDPNELNDRERALLSKVAGIGIGSTLSGFAFGFYGSKFLPWKKFERLSPPKHYVLIGRSIFGFGALGVAFIFSQRWGLQQIMNLGDESALLFHTKRFLMSQRGNMMFARSEIKSVSKSEMERLGNISSTDYRDHTMSTPAPDGSINTEFALSQEQFLPIAQTGYKPPPA